MKFTVGGRPIDLTSEDVVRAMDGVEAEAVREHVVQVAERSFPPKQVLGIVTGWPRQSFTTMEAQRVLARLGFPCRRIEELLKSRPAKMAAGDNIGTEALNDESALSTDGRGPYWRIPSSIDRNMTVREALTDGRRQVASALALGATTGPEPDEETLSWLLQSTAAWNCDRITVRAFTRHEESNYTGADWLWWWEGNVDEWFGCLVQAKRIFPAPGGPTFDFGYRPTQSRNRPEPPLQIQRLLDASDNLGVPAAYLLYRSPILGEPGPWSCPKVVPDWNTAAATFVAAAIVNEWLATGRPTELEVARPIECLACDGLCGNDLARLAWYARNLADPAVRRILSAPPSTAARRAFRAMFTEVVQIRSVQFRGSAPGIPDQMHSGFRLGEHFSRGLRHPPPYVASILGGEEQVDAPELAQVAGVVIVSDE